MARRIGPDEASREVKAIVAKTFRSKDGSRAQLWSDDAATVPADVLFEDGSAIPVEQPANNGGRGMAPTVPVDGSSMLPLIQYPPGDVDFVVVTCDGGPPWRAYARTDDRLDALGVRVGTVEGVAAGLGNAATRNVGTTAGTVAQGDDSRLVNALPRYATMRFDPTGKPNGALPASADTGETLTPFVATNPAPLSISGGLIVHTPAAGVNSAGYLQTPLSSRVRRIGAMVSWPTSALGIAAFVIPSASWADGSLDAAGFHLTLNGNGIWILSRFAGGTQTIASSSTHGRFPIVWGTGLQRFDFWLDPETQTCVLVWPDGSFTRVTSPYFASETSSFAVWELFENNGSDVSASFGAVWASTIDAPAYQEYFTPYRLQQGAMNNPAVYNASGAVTVDTGATLTHQVTMTGNITSLTFTGTPSRGALVHLELIQDGTGARTLSGVASAIKWAGSAAPTLTATANRRDIFRFRFEGSSWLEVSRSMNVG